MKRTYCDHAADTPVRPRAAAAFAQAMAFTGNPSSAHGAGQDARRVVEEARDQISAGVGCAPGDLIFTSGGTEANNLALKGIAWALPSERRHVVTSAVEHPAVLAPLRWLADRGEISMTVVGCGPDGRVDPDVVMSAVREDTGLVSIMVANNVVGAVNDVGAIGAALTGHPAFFHVDAVQAMHLEVDFTAWQVDAASLSPHKFGGPVGSGVAMLRRGMPVHSLLHGGDQDRGVRSGTLAAGLAAAAASAVQETVSSRRAEHVLLEGLRSSFLARLLSRPNVTVLGPEATAHRLPGTAALAVSDVAADALVFALDRAGLSVSVGPACSSGATSSNPVLEAMGITADAGLRISFGWTSTQADADRAATIVNEVLAELTSEAA